MAPPSQRTEWREMAYSHGWASVTHTYATDVFALDDEDEPRYLYIGYRDIGLDETVTALVLPKQARILRISDPHQIPELLEHWIIDHSTLSEDEFYEDEDDDEKVLR